MVQYDVIDENRIKFVEIRRREYKELDKEFTDLEELLLLEVKDSFYTNFDFEELLLEEYETDLLDLNYYNIKEWLEFLIGPNFKTFINWFLANMEYFNYAIEANKRSYKDRKDYESYQIIFFQMLANLMTYIFSHDEFENIILGRNFKEDYSKVGMEAPEYAAFLIDSADTVLIRELEDVLSDEEKTELISPNIIFSIVYSKNKNLVKKLGELVVKYKDGFFVQYILENIDAGRIEHLKYFVSLLIEEDLLKYDASKRSILLWTNLNFLELENDNMIEELAYSMLKILSDDSNLENFLNSSNNIELYIGLWYMATNNLKEAKEKAMDIIDKGNKDSTIVSIIFMKTADDYQLNKEITRKTLKTSNDLEIINWISHLFTMYIGYSRLEDLNVEYDIPKEYRLDEELSNLIFKNYEYLLKVMEDNINFKNSGFEGNTLKYSKEILETGLFVSAMNLEDKEKSRRILEINPNEEIYYKCLKYNFNSLDNDEDRKTLIINLNNEYERVVDISKTYLKWHKLKYTEDEIVFLTEILKTKNNYNVEAVIDILLEISGQEYLNVLDILFTSNDIEGINNALILSERRLEIEEDINFKEEIIDLLKSLEFEEKEHIKEVNKILNKEVVLDIEDMKLVQENEELVVDKPSRNINVKKELLPLTLDEFKEYTNLFIDYIYENKDRTEVIEKPSSSEEIKFKDLEYAYKYDSKDREGFDKLIFASLWEKFFSENKVGYEFLFEIKYCKAYQMEYKNRYAKTYDIKEFKEEHLPIKNLERKITYLDKSVEKINTYKDGASRLISTIDIVMTENFIDKGIDPDVFLRIEDLIKSLYYKIPDKYYDVEKVNMFTLQEGNMNEVAGLKSLELLLNEMGKLSEIFDKGFERYFKLVNAFYLKSSQDENIVYFMKNNLMMEALDSSLIEDDYYYNYLLDTNYGKGLFNRVLRNEEILEDQTIEELYPETYAKTKELSQSVIRFKDMEMDKMKDLFNLVDNSIK